MRTVPCQYQSVLRATRSELCEFVFVAFEGQMYVRYGPETHTGANIARAVQRDVVARRAKDLEAGGVKSIK